MSEADRRGSPRVRTLLKGRIIFNNRQSVIDCTVRDISETGAQIAFDSIFDPPSQFQLEVPRKNQCVWARVAWSNGKNYGVMFFEPGYVASRVIVADDCAVLLQGILERARREISLSAGIPLEQVNLQLDLSGSPQRVA